jgi:hypothetical protein
MKLQIWCLQCSTATPARRSSCFAELREDGVYEVRGDRGHRVLAALQNHRFELLFDSAALALRDDYYREAVATFAAALEAFWGFYARVVARHFGVKPEEIPQLQKDLKLSERRAGAMFLAHLLLTGAAYQGDPASRRTFRNNVLHDGYFPSRDEAMSYGRYVHDTILDGLEELRAEALRSIQLEVSAVVSRAHDLLRARPGNESETIQTQLLGTLVNCLGGGTRRPFDEAFRMFADGLHVWHEPAPIGSELDP